MQPVVLWREKVRESLEFIWKLEENSNKNFEFFLYRQQFLRCYYARLMLRQCINISSVCLSVKHNQKTFLLIFILYGICIELIVLLSAACVLTIAVVALNVSVTLCNNWQFLIGDNLSVNTRIYYKKLRFRWPCRQSYRSEVARLMGVCVQTLLMARMFVSCVCCVLSRQRDDIPFRAVLLSVRVCVFPCV